MIFWRHGYAGSSLAQLSAALGMKRPSLKAAFGDKKAIYLLVLQRCREELSEVVTFDYTFTVPGTYRYFCVPHEKLGMVGTVVVKK